MAGMEQLEIHSRSYLVRWVNVPSGHTISWSLQPHKKSINFGLFKHPGVTGPGTPGLPPLATLEQSQIQQSEGESDRDKVKDASGKDVNTVIDKLSKLGMKPVAWTGRCDAGSVSMGHYDVSEGGMYGLVFDNTHSKHAGKMVTFVLMTYPTDAPPKSGHSLHFSQAMKRQSAISLRGDQSPVLAPTESNESLPKDLGTNKAMLDEMRPVSNHAREFITPSGSTFYTGALSKKRRKRNQGFARRFFSLDFTSSTLSYYKNRTSSALRGAIPLSLAAVAADEKRKQFSIDSGTEIWVLKASNQEDFERWRAALERASNSAAAETTPTPTPGAGAGYGAPTAMDEREWSTIEGLVGRVAGITDAMRRLTKDTDPKLSPPKGGLGIQDAGNEGQGSSSPTESSSGDYFSLPDKAEKSSFWKRKSSQGAQSPSATIFRRSISGQKLSPASLAPPSPYNGSLTVPKRQSISAGTITYQHELQIHNRCNAVLRDLDSVVAEFSTLVAQSRRRRLARRPSVASYYSVATTKDEEFFDAETGSNRHSQLLEMAPESDDDAEMQDADDASVGGDSSYSSDAEGEATYRGASGANEESLFPAKPKSLNPLPKSQIVRRDTIPPSTGPPPSLISFLRKNVGKDLSTIATPVTANEPLSLLQRQSEQLEYSELLDAATTASKETGERLLYVTAFAISALSNLRVKERAVRKPFNPMLGETFELVREDKGFRLLAEKISHRPVRVACQAEAKDWTFVHAPMPTQKFWGKSAELITEGRVRVVLHRTGDRYSWAPASCFLRNIIAGEKYVEPVQTMTIQDETSGCKAVVSFRSGGMFSGRSEDVDVHAFHPGGDPFPLELHGKWTTSLTLTSTVHGHQQGAGQEVWRAGPLLKNAPTRFGMTAFAAQLNEVTALEEGALPPTDSRLRPDQREYEVGHVDKAEELKLKLEEAQRRRRKEMELAGEKWAPRWFEMAGTEGEEEVWRLKDGQGDGYWDVRDAVINFKGGKWNGVKEVFEL